jgi:hypothetical protein
LGGEEKFPREFGRYLPMFISDDISVPINRCHPSNGSAGTTQLTGLILEPIV